jgi:MtN3 and saliva related transmembrane protein
MNQWLHGFVNEIGLFAAFLTTISFVPQLIKIWRSRSARDVSLGMFCVFVAGVTLWLTYGLLINDLPMILANTVTLSLALAILVLKLKFDRKGQK